MLIETLPAVFQMDEILHALRDHIVGLNCGRWDYIFSYIKTLKNHPDRVLPDRQVVTMDKPFLSAYSRLLIKTCHKRGAFAMGGMAAFIPSKDAERNNQVLNKVKPISRWRRITAMTVHGSPIPGWLTPRWPSLTVYWARTKISCRLPAKTTRRLPLNSCWPLRGRTNRRGHARQYSRGGAVHRGVDLR